MIYQHSIITGHRDCDTWTILSCYCATRFLGYLRYDQPARQGPRNQESPVFVPISQYVSPPITCREWKRIGVDEEEEGENAGKLDV